MRKYKGWFNLAGTLLVMLVIFYSSSQPYSKQDMRPELGLIFDHPFWKEAFSFVSFTYAGSEVSIEANGVTGFIEFFFRKFAHLAVFFCLGFFTLRTIQTLRKLSRFSAPLSFSLVVLYAALDEVHQYFTGDRTPLWQDVMIDSVGGVIGILFSMFLWHRKKKRTQYATLT